MTSNDVWNRAAMKAGGAELGPGDVALADVLRVHSLAMNGGLLQALEMCSAEEVEAAVKGYEYLGMDDAAAAVLWLAGGLAGVVADDYDKLGVLEVGADERYAAAVPTDATIVEAFEAHFAVNPGEYAGA